jgi:soluble lytic murein transglycosylase-like protein
LEEGYLKMAIDGLNKISNEQLMAMNLTGNGQLTDDSSSTSGASDEKNLAFQLVMENLLESSKNSKQSNEITSTDGAASVNGEVNKSQDLTSEDSGSTNDALSIKNNIARVVQKYSTGQNLKDIPMILNDNYVGFTGSANTISYHGSDADMQKIYSAVSDASKKYGVDSNLILAIINQESNFNPNSTSGAGAEGLMQIMPQNFNSVGITDGYDIDQNVNGGTKLLKSYLDQYNGNTEMALMAYNGGPGTMQKRGVSSASELYKMPQETQNYVPKVMGYYKNGV